MTRKVLVLAVVAATATGYAVLAQPARRGPEWDLFQPAKPVKKWQYATLTEVKLDQGRVAVLVEGAGLTSACNGGWIEAAELLGMKIAPEYPRTNVARARQMALDQMGDLGWELVGTHRGDLDRPVWVFKRER